MCSAFLRFRKAMRLSTSPNISANFASRQPGPVWSQSASISPFKPTPCCSNPSGAGGLGMALHELMTNSAQHACFDDRAGEIKVKLSLAHPVVNCIIVDNGSLFKRLEPARGLGLVRDLIKSLLEYGFGPEHSSFLLVFLLTERERRANRAAASRRARTPRRPKTIRSIPKQTATAQLANPAGIPSSLQGPTPASNAPEGAPLLGAARATDKADVLTQLFAKPRI